MRAWILCACLCLTATSARADAGDVSVGAAVGAGGQGPATYGALELRFDAAWPDAGVVVGLGGRAVWDDGVFRKTDWASAADAVTIVRDVRVVRALGEGVTLAAAAGGLAPSHLADVADGYRAALDDLPRTGARVAVAADAIAATAEIDDVLDPALVGAAATWQLAPPWAAFAAIAVDPGASPMLRAHEAIEAGVMRHVARIELAGGVMVEPDSGAAAIASARTALDRGDVRFTAAADVRAGTGDVGSAFGPLYRAERALVWMRSGVGAGAGASFGVAAPAGWVDASLRERPGLGALAALAAGAPLGRYVQAAGWLAAARDASAGAAELRVAWARRLFSSLQLARMIHADDSSAWSLTVWFGAAS